MMGRVLTFFDPLVRLLLVAIVAASLLPVSGQGAVIARIVSDVAIFLLFLLNGLRLPRSKVFTGLRHLRFLLPLIVFVFGVMGLVGWFVSARADGLLPASVALGFLFLGVLPSTVQSATAYTSLAGGNVANSVVAAAVLNILGVFISAPIIALVVSGGVAGLDLGTLERIGMILLLPFLLGQMLQGWLGPLVADRKRLFSLMDRFAIAIAVYVAFSGAVVQGLWTFISLGEWLVLLGLVGLMLAVGFIGAWALGGALGLLRADRISFLFAGAQKSIAMGAPLAAVLFAPEVAGLILLPVLIYHLVQLIISAPLASRFTRQG
ncbi:bile acid:sodium symporter [Aurantiacibacter sp. MUD61]|uniref:bile acid:sodium symporter n=1 Tax=Aurantiacibacter sp. MUD61 TaxID=3009083 RepID=UPI0022F0CAB4|nr:bile acid:sodium symporter [Aurantiacibacter sp. MUD61]